MAGVSLRVTSDRSAGSRPARDSWVGKTPRVSSRNDSSAEFVLSTRRSMPDSGDPPRSRGAPGGSRREAPSATAAPRARWPPPGSAAPRRRASTIRSRDSASALVVRSSSATCSASSPASAVLRNATAVWSASASSRRTSAGRSVATASQGDLDVPQVAPLVAHRRPCGPERRRRSPRCRRAARCRARRAWPGRRSPRPTVRPPRRSPGAGSRRGRLGQPAAEVRERFVGLGARAVGQPVGEPDHAAAQRLERERDHGGAQQGEPEASGPALDEPADGHHQVDVAEGRERRAGRPGRRSG